MATAAAATILTPDESLALPAVPGRQLHLHNLHTGERLKGEYWSRGRYLKDGIRAFSRILRDHRTGDVHPIDPKLFDILHQLQRRLGFRDAVHVVSGYRSPATNAMLRENDSDGVAKFSYHMVGKAIDIRVPGIPLRTLHRASLSLRAGGVGYYPDSNFVHVDVGPLRRW
ncbi:DUF882 domain-containing protein [Azospirillum halopraeferens]|uniref:DUF882 domain-containing protein n=1 Tax=Azospirillum halopraeferens TaxID=34010 RepID=UPI00316AE77F